MSGIATAHDGEAAAVNGGAGTNVGGTKPVNGTLVSKGRQSQETGKGRFPLKHTCRISEAMNRSLQRLTVNNSLFGEADIMRMALHSYLTANDPQYSRELSNGNA